MKTGIFLRYINSNRIIRPNIKDKVSELIPLLEKNNDNVISFLQKHIKHTPEPECSVEASSTWHAATLELYKQYERYSETQVDENNR